ncbi:MAG TPA: methylenetetrahydrofolate--tRNA-(uracil(54)-C(5))-methyltransferase (FADH(2)-oxidizing) TrmFO, partial [Clostridia bacterium]|nr:methylenetetrahydrofolate--tRNA-(uracil(54)-C(5))-methyltransferase (FADH(2)-oxidizing) TrmFO [Clostridia bacterium]
VEYDSLDMEKVFRASRYDRGSDYLNCPMNRTQYEAFLDALIAAETAPLREFETLKVFEGCMPVEVMAKRGKMTLAYGPLKPVGLRDERTGERPFAVVQLRQDDKEGRLYNIVGFQTNLKFPEQKRVFGMIPGLENANFVRYGVMHRNSFLNSPGKLSWDFQAKACEGLYFAGQFTGVEGYIESAASGLVAGINLAHKLTRKDAVDFTRQTAIGALAHYVSEYAGKDFQPMNVNFGIMDALENPPRNKLERYEQVSARALAAIDEIIAKKM